ncbi:uncharacterized protein LY79DRAFT_523035 [Colletotrichum navitas]|uniref:DUF7888 domain-containing protein n=1 Tax=Colletotrichum navitas TaxID=681940 RepID=A0AAD8V204_9PEZI|nr:uncharacterized protein LY79DRAFT_523035 [Colletotrichum navitas]KAK1579219.1 hypothetical protein LY79DRAFT_523035 [Colletotrichum navitas]
MHVSTLGLCICYISSATLLAALKTTQPQDTQIPPNANIPHFESVVLVDGVQPAVKRDSVRVKLSSPKEDLATREIPIEGVSGLERRQAEILALIAAAIPIGITIAAFSLALSAIQDAQDFDDGRKKFTSTQVEEMWDLNPDYNKFPAAACYDLGYRLANPAGFDQLASITLTAGSKKVVYVLY